MTLSKSMLLAIGVVTGIGIGAIASSFAFSPWENSPLMRGQGDNWNSGNELGTLSSNDGIYVDVTDFKITKGAAKGDPAAQIAKLHAREASEGAIIFRHCCVCFDRANSDNSRGSSGKAHGG
jgi:hypothetical protein